MESIIELDWGRRMTAFDQVLAYRRENDTLPADGYECQEMALFAKYRGVQQMPEEDSIIAVVQMLRQQQQEISGQRRLL
ncbi:MAG: hypothetical protein IPJ48_15135 [Propionivibrio sp.]|uniref:Uncharacterized protein n=1 Tax=Candidatus Propionivibrio dominans TaxID=2954373 RepID=A0A9D7FDC0_9RHOO|nr:hypothetical protein [Candidatus Propionivibrio dominans]